MKVRVPIPDEVPAAREAGHQVDPTADAVFLCRRIPPVTSEVFDLLQDVFRRIRNEAISQSLRGAPNVGRPRIYDHDKIRRLRALGLSQRAIAAEVGCSRSAVRKALRQ